MINLFLLETLRYGPTSMIGGGGTEGAVIVKVLLLVSVHSLEPASDVGTALQDCST